MVNQKEHRNSNRIIHIWEILAPWIATLGVGRIPYGPGTWGSLLGLLIWKAMALESQLVMVVAIVALLIIGIFAISTYERRNKIHDPKEVVVDECVGIWIALIGLPMLPINMAIAFGLFRFFDILKPFPISWVDRKWPGALGTMFDDVVAGLFTFIILTVLRSYQWLI